MADRTLHEPPPKEGGGISFDDVFQSSLVQLAAQLVEQNMPEPSNTDRPPTTASTRPLIVFGVVQLMSLLLAAGFYAWVGLARPDNANFWGMMGDVVAPFAALFSAFALFAALWAVHLQRRELELQREELREGREVMQEQRRQLERAAKAQTLLGIVTGGLALEQREANRLGWFSEVAQKRSTLASLHAAISRLDLAAVEHGMRAGHFKDLVANQTKRSRDYLELLAAEENQRIRFVEKGLKINYKVNPADAWVGHVNPLEITEDGDEAKS